MKTKFDYKQFLDMVSAGRIEDAFDYRATFTPDYLYKFFPLVDNSKDKKNQQRFYSLANNYLWFATPEVQNDPYEFMGLYWDEDQLLKMGVQQRSIDDTKTLLLKQIALTAFTSNMDNNLPMWAHYANNHHGYCVKYKVGNKHTIRNVIYDSQRISMTKTFLNLIHMINKGITMQDKSFIDEANIYSAVLQDKFFYKHNSWEYENEYRALWPFESDKTGFNLPIAELSLTVQEIYSGINCSDENKKELSNIATILNVPFKECAMSNSEFTVLVEK